MLSTFHKRERIGPQRGVSEPVRKAIDVIYDIYGKLKPEDKAVIEGNRRYSLCMHRVDQGMFLIIVDYKMFTLHHNEDLHPFHAAKSYAGINPDTLKSRYAVSKPLKKLIKELPGCGIDITKVPKLTLLQ